MRRILTHPLAHLLYALLVIAVVQAFFVKVYQVPSASMAETLSVGDRLLVNRLAYRNSEPSRGEIAVFERPEGWNEVPTVRGPLRTAVGWVGDIFGIGPSNSDALVKRVIAVGGDEIECCDAGGSVVVNGEALDEPYLGSNLPFELGVLDCESTPRSQRCFPPLTVPEGNYLMLGDNRANSSDGISRCRGIDAADSMGCARLVPREDVIGRVFFVILPPGHWGSPY